MDTPAPINENLARQHVGLDTETAAQVIPDAFAAFDGEITATVIRETRAQITNFEPDDDLTLTAAECAMDEVDAERLPSGSPPRWPPPIGLRAGVTRSSRGGNGKTGRVTVAPGSRHRESPRGA